MDDPSTYEKNKAAPDALNFVNVPKLINAMSWNFSKGSILDYGCGPGSTGYKLILPQVKSTDSQMYSTDISPSMVQFAKENFPHSKIQYGAAGSLPDNFPFSDLQFDKIFAVNVFHFVPDVKVMISSMFDILKPGGELGFTCGTAEAFQVWKILAESETWGPFMKNYTNFWPRWSVYCNHEDPNQYFRNVFLQNTGFQEILFEFSKQNVSTDADVLTDAVMSTNPCLPDIPREMYGEFKEDFRMVYAGLLGTSVDSPIYTVNVEYLCVVLRKPI